MAEAHPTSPDPIFQKIDQSLRGIRVVLCQKIPRMEEGQLLIFISSLCFVFSIGEKRKRISKRIVYKINSKISILAENCFPDGIF